MTLENIISFALGALVINVKIPSVIPSLNIQTPIENMFSSGDLHEIIISGIKVIVAGFGSVAINRIFHKKPTEKK